MRPAFKKSVWLLLFLLTVAVGRAQQFPEPSQPPRLVNDFAGMLSTGQQQALETKLVQFDRQTSTQIAVVTVDDLQGLDVSDYAARLFDRWGIGRQGSDNGILILAKPKTADSNGRVFIATGYGLEGVVPDALAGRIVDYDILPAFRTGDYYAGLDSATNTLMGLTRGEFTAQEYLDRSNNPKGSAGPMVMLLLLFVFLIWFFRRRPPRGNSGSSTGGGMIPPIFFGGGPGGGGFGGFGGGRSGGGGAGGSW